MIDWWSEIEQTVVETLASAGALSPQELGRRVGISEGEAVAFLCMLAREKKVAIQLVGPVAAPSGVARGADRPRAKAPVMHEPAYAGGH
jgi:hypothetical protein